MKKTKIEQLVILICICFLSGNIYAQCIEGDCYTGTGTMIFDSGNKYQGEFKDGKREGRGTFVWVSGAKYQGQWLNDKMHGTGTYIFPDRRYYKGEFKNGLKDGSGVLAYENGKVIQKGMWKADSFIESSKTRSYVNAGMSIFESILPDQNFWSVSESSYLLPVGVSFDYGVTNELNIGLFVGYAYHNLSSTNMRLDNDISNLASTDIDYTFILSGARVTYNLHLFDNASIIPYIGGSVGYNFITEKISVDGTEESAESIQAIIRKEAGYQDNAPESEFSYSAFGGVRVFPLENIGIFAEGGFGFTNLSAGLTYRF